MQLTKKMAEKRIAFMKAKAIEDGIHVQPASYKIHKNLTALLDAEDVQYYPATCFTYVYKCAYVIKVFVLFFSI